MKTDAQANQKMMSKGDQEHMVMPAQPTACLVMVKTDLAFVLLKMISMGHRIPLIHTNSSRGVSTGALLK